MPGILRWLGGLRQADAINSTLRAHQTCFTGYCTQPREYCRSTVTALTQHCYGPVKQV